MVASGKNDFIRRMNITVKQQLIAEIESIDNPVALVQLVEIIQLVKQNMTKTKSNHLLFQFAGCLNDSDAQEMRNIITNEFNKIKGKWCRQIIWQNFPLSEDTTA
jgi:hypothetical protein